MNRVVERNTRLVILNVCLLASACERPDGETSATSAAAMVVRVATVRPERLTVRRTAEEPGQIEAFEVTPIHAKVAGYVRKVCVDIGDRVKKGDLLAEIDVPEVAADLKQKRASIEEAEAETRQAEGAVVVSRAEVASAEARVNEFEAGIQRAEADVARWQAEFRRIEQLFQERAQTGTLLDETRSKLRAAEASRDEVRAQVKSAEAALAEFRARREKAQLDVAAAVSQVDVARFEAERAEAMDRYCRLSAPYDGVVIRRKVDTGQLTTPGTSTEPLLVLARFDRVTISVGVPEADAPFVNAGDAAEIRLPALDGRKFPGKVTRTAWALDATTRTLLTEIDLPNADGLLRPGLYAYAAIIAEEHPNALTLPTTAIGNDGPTSFCVAVVGNRAVRKAIRVGLVDGKRTEVVSGLTVDDDIVEANVSGLADGQPVERIKPESASRPKN